MPKKLNGAGGMQEYIPAGNGDASGEYGNSKGENKHFSSFKKGSSSKSKTKESNTPKSQNKSKNYKKGTIANYKGYGIDYDIYGNGEFSVQYGGDDVLFNSEEEARAFIDKNADNELEDKEHYEIIDKIDKANIPKEKKDYFYKQLELVENNDSDVYTNTAQLLDDLENETSENNKSQNPTNTKSNQVTYNGKKYDVDSTAYNGAIINVFGTSITDEKKQGIGGNGYTVFDEGEEIYFNTFDEAYNYAKKIEKKRASNLFGVDL